MLELLYATFQNRVSMGLIMGFLAWGITATVKNSHLRKAIRAHTQITQYPFPINPQRVEYISPYQTLSDEAVYHLLYMMKRWKSTYRKPKAPAYETVYLASLKNYLTDQVAEVAAECNRRHLNETGQSCPS